jgi:hypothetical protein
MTAARIRSGLAAAVIAALMSYGLTGHAVPQINSHDGMAGATVGLCLLLATVLGLAAAPRPERNRAALVTDAAPAFVDQPSPPPLDGRARASPSALQRFRH